MHCQLEKSVIRKAPLTNTLDLSNSKCFPVNLSELRMIRVYTDCCLFNLLDINQN